MGSTRCFSVVHSLVERWACPHERIEHSRSAEVVVKAAPVVAHARRPTAPPERVGRRHLGRWVVVAAGYPVVADHGQRDQEGAWTRRSRVKWAGSCVANSQ